MNTITFSQFAGDGKQHPSWGRFANQVLQVAFLETYAAQYGCNLQLNPWVGNVLFNHRREAVTATLPPWLEQTDHLEQAQPPKGDELVNHDFLGYSQYHTSYYKGHQDFVKLLFQPTAAVQERLLPALATLKGQGKTVVGIHLRRGDYGRLIFYCTPVRWYKEWLATFWDELEDPVLFIATETPSLVREFAAYNPVTAEDLGVELGTMPLPEYAYLAPDLASREPLQMDFAPDWVLLSHCDILLAGNSTFPFTAAMMGQCRKYFRSDLGTEKFIELDPWNAYPLTHERAEDFRHVPGVCLDETAYWRRLPGGGFEEKV